MKQFSFILLFSLLAGMAAVAGDPVKLLVVGDSTAADYPADVAPRKGWGQMLQQFFDPARVTVLNGARSGRSSKSFFNEGWWKEYLAQVGKGDYVLIQFGHNDEKPDEDRHTDPDSTYREWLTRYITEARARGVTPILLTSIQRNAWEGAKVKDTHLGYPQAMRELARELSVPLIDLQAETGMLMESLGPERMNEIFLILDPGQSPNYPDGVVDNTHLQESGARRIAAVVAAKLKALNLPLPADSWTAVP